jgi:phosphatidylglycerol:prolipoprotein diacylglycerol transferase
MATFFPVVWTIGGVAISAHVFFEAAAYFVGFRLYLRRRRNAGDFLDPITRMWIVVAAVLGAAIGSKVLAWFSDPAETLAHWRARP